MATYLTTTSELTAIADAIRAKAGTASTMSYPDGFVSTISAISTGGGGSVENAAATYSANQGNKCAITLSNGQYSEYWSDSDTPSTVGVWMTTYGSGINNYMMVATSSGAVAWKGKAQLITAMSGGMDPSMGGTDYNYQTGGGAMTALEANGYPEQDPETMTDIMRYNYTLTVSATDNSCPTVYLSTTSF